MRGSRVLRRVSVLAVVALLAGVLAGVATAADGDQDGFDDSLDNCPALFNPDQRDDDRDGAGNTCDSTPGVRPETDAFLVLYLRDQTGGPIPAAQYPGVVFGVPNGPCFQLTRYMLGEDVRTPERWCTTDAGWTSLILTRASGVEWQDLVQLSPPPGCSGGLTGPVRHFWRPGTWETLDVRYQCGAVSPPPPPPPP
ncbi:MAG: hypothetical protein ABR569_12850, partial [Gaiellaceae bacterium]